jgi:hypothetical protein
MRDSFAPAFPLETDLTLETPHRRAILAVECKYGPDTSRAEAAYVRNGLLTGYRVSVASESYFMLVLRSMFHLWKPGTAPDAPPDFSVDGTPVLRAYLGRLVDRPLSPDAESLEFAVAEWLGDLAISIREPRTDADRMLVEAGVFDLMKGGSVRHEISPYDR